MNAWRECKKILCVRPDNMGDLLMTVPAIAALKQTFGCHISVLTSSMAKDVAALVPVIDDIIVWDVPWVKTNPASQSEAMRELLAKLREKNFDGAVIFTVFSQSSLPAALVLTMAGIPNRLAYCRENPYLLLSHWIPDEEPYNFIRHQVRRDLDLVRSIGAHNANKEIAIHLRKDYSDVVRQKLMLAGADPAKPWLIFHPGVSERKREYPAELWIAAGKRITGELNHQVIITGSASERTSAENIRKGVGDQAHNLAGSLTLEEFITLIQLSSLLISVNTGSVHLASAVNTPVVVLYALTNPQHPPWNSVGRVLPFSTPEHLQSRNEVLRYVQEKIFTEKRKHVAPDEIVRAASDLLLKGMRPRIPELVLS